MGTLGWAWWLCFNSLKGRLGGGGGGGGGNGGWEFIYASQETQLRKIYANVIDPYTLTLIFTAILNPINLSSVEPKD